MGSLQARERLISGHVVDDALVSQLQLERLSSARVDFRGYFCPLTSETNGTLEAVLAAPRPPRFVFVAKDMSAADGAWRRGQQRLDSNTGELLGHAHVRRTEKEDTIDDDDDDDEDDDDLAEEVRTCRLTIHWYDSRTYRAKSRKPPPHVLM